MNKNNNSHAVFVSKKEEWYFEVKKGDKNYK
jgi:hypothetical protein